MNKDCFYFISFHSTYIHIYVNYLEEKVKREGGEGGCRQREGEAWGGGHWEESWGRGRLQGREEAVRGRSQGPRVWGRREAAREEGGWGKVQGGRVRDGARREGKRDSARRDSAREGQRQGTGREVVRERQGTKSKWVSEEAGHEEGLREEHVRGRSMQEGGHETEGGRRQQWVSEHVHGKG